ncbi:unnamed protein product [Ascophyllum nodosum]
MSEGAQPSQQVRSSTTTNTRSNGHLKRPRSVTPTKPSGILPAENPIPRYGTRSTTKVRQRRQSIIAQLPTQQSEFSRPGKNVAAADTILSSNTRVLDGGVSTPLSTGGEREALGTFPPKGSSTANASEAAVTESASVSSVAPIVRTIDPTAGCLGPSLAPSGYTRKSLPVQRSGSWVGGSRQARLRLSLEKRRALPVPQLEATLSTASIDRKHGDGSESAPQGYPKSVPFQQQSRSKFEAPGALPASGVPNLGRHDFNLNRSSVVASERASALPRDQTSTPPPPPFVGLVNLGETCYINAVVQALVACSRAILSSTGRCSPSDTAHVMGSNRTCGESGVPAASRQGSNGEKEVVLWSAAIVDANDFRVSEAEGAGVAGNTGESVLIAVDNLLKEVDERNRALLAGGFDDSNVQKEAQHTRTIQMVDWEGSLTLGVRPRDEIPLGNVKNLRNGDTHMNVVVPETLVKLVREGWLSASRSRGDSWAGNAPRARGLEGISTNFGCGQECVSELFGKLLDLGISHVDGEAHGIATRLSQAFRGSVCTQTLCVECERDRLDRDTFTELVLPPLLPLPSSSDHEGHKPSAVKSTSSPKSLTLLELVKATLGSESLVGNNKVWCQFCRQQGEAERRSTLHCSPRLLALHLRPATDEISDRPVESAWASAPGSLKAMPENRHCVRSVDSKLIERVMAIQGASMCQFHETTRAEAGAAKEASYTDQEEGATVDDRRGKHEKKKQLPLPDPSFEVVYDLVGIILHQGRSMGSGHYTFARHVLHDHAPSRRATISDSGTGRPSVIEKSDNRRVEDSNDAQYFSFQDCQGQDGRENSQSRLPPDENFVIFDDACVRFLSPEEERILLNGGGSSWGFGDAFLVFYARRDS